MSVSREIAVERFAECGVNFDEMVRKMSELLTEYYHENTTEGIEAILCEYAENKWELMQFIKKHPNYNGNLQISVTADFVYRINPNEISNVLYGFLSRIHAREKILKTVNERGLNFTETLEETISDIPLIVKFDELETLQKMKELNSLNFNRDGYYIPSVKDFEMLVRINEKFANYGASTVSDYFADTLNAFLPKIVNDDGTVKSHGIKAAAGQKTSRAFNKAFSMFGFEKDAEYLKEFPAYADLVKEGNITREIVISINPIDYYTMSFGNTWASCHTIDKTNRRGRRDGYSGGYCGGTESYMLDDCTMVVYAPVPHKDAMPETVDKIYRNMIMYKNGMLLQSRLYPQSNDGCVDLLAEFRHIEQKAICECLGIDYISENKGSDTWIKKGASSQYDEYYSYTGMQYHDYRYSSFNGNISYIRGTELHSDHMHIGHRTICPKCGTYHMDANGRLLCDNCY